MAGWWVVSPNKFLLHTKYATPYSPLTPFPPCCTTTEYPLLYVTTSTTYHHKYPPKFLPSPELSHTPQLYKPASRKDILAHYAVQLQKEQLDHEHAEHSKQHIQQLIQKLRDRVDLLPQKETIPLHRTIIGLVTRPEIDTQQVLALFIIARKARCINMDVYAAIIDHYLARNADQSASKLYDYLRVKEGLFSPQNYNGILRALCGGGQVDKALESFKHMLESGVQPNKETFVILLQHTYKRHDVCMGIFEEMKKYGIKITTNVFNIAISSCNYSKNASQALSLRDQMIEQGVPMNVSTYNGFIAVLFSVGRSSEGLGVFEHMKRCGIVPNTQTYVLLFMDGRDNMARHEELLREMDRIGVRPSIQIYDLMLNCHGKNLDVPGMRAIFARMLSCGIKPSQKTYGIFIKNLCHNDLFQEAFKMVEEIELNQAGYMRIMWVAIVKKCFDKAQSIFQIILDRGMIPNSLTYIVVMLMCVHGNRHAEIEGILSHMLTHGDDEAKMLARILRTYGVTTQLNITNKLRIYEFGNPGSITTFIKLHMHRLYKQQNDSSYYVDEHFNSG